MYKPALDLMKNYQGMYFVADYHALTTMRDPQGLKELVYEVAASWLALGLDPDEAIFFRQSDIPEIPEFAWILACFTSKGLLNRAHAYKDAVDQNLELGHDPDEGINAGLFYYPVLMAADILKTVRAGKKLQQGKDVILLRVLRVFRSFAVGDDLHHPFTKLFLRGKDRDSVVVAFAHLPTVNSGHLHHRFLYQTFRDF